MAHLVHQVRQTRRQPSQTAALGGMPCYHPKTAYQPTAGGPLSFHEKKDHKTLTLPCGQCRGCRLTSSRTWAIRCVHESQMHKFNSYITLTYNDEHLAPELSLDYRDWQLFVKRIKKRLARHAASPHLLCKEGTVRFYVGGEYGPRYGRPHWHACLFGLDFADRVPYKKTNSGEMLDISQTLTDIWGKGFASVGNITFNSAAYIARYIMKKRTGDGNKKNYEIIDPETGEIKIRRKELNNMSRRPGVGSTWLGKYTTDVYPEGKTIIKAHRFNAPRYYDKQYKALLELHELYGNKQDHTMEDLRYARYLEQIAHAHDHTDERLLVQEQVAEAKTRTLKRNLD